MGAFNGSGTFVRSYSWVTDKTNGVPITASRVDTEDTGFASGLTLCVTRDGQGAMAASFIAQTGSVYDLGSIAVPWRGVLSQYLRASGGAVQGLGPVAAAFVDMTPDTGTFNGTLTGGTTSPTVTCTWTRVGKQVTLNFGASSGITSNAVTFGLTGLPAAIQPATLDQFVAVPYPVMEDNGTFGQNAAVLVTHASGTLQFWRNASSSTWTASGTKGWTGGWSISYLLN